MNLISFIETPEFTKKIVELLPDEELGKTPNLLVRQS